MQNFKHLAWLFFILFGCQSSTANDSTIIFFSDTIETEFNECKPNCFNRECGPDDCAGSCGDCSGSDKCVNGICKEIKCKPNCSGKECGPDGCSGNCGACSIDSYCSNGECVVSNDGPYCGMSRQDTCVGNVVKECYDDKLYEIDCEELGTTCGYVDEEWGYDCLDCGNVPTAGICEGNLLITCILEKNVQGWTDCNLNGSICGWDKTNEKYDCLLPTSKFGESCEGVSCEEGLLCIDWTNKGSSITCTKFCETDAECPNSCCGQYAVEDKKICTDLYLAITKNKCYQTDYGESCANNVVCKNGLNCFDWTPSGGAITCGKYCQNDNECYPTCCGPYNVEGKNVCTPLEMSSICPVPCTPNCAGKECGNDGCGEQCGSCGIYGCLNGKCVKEFIDLGNGTIKTPWTTGDFGTNLIWQKNPSEKIYHNIMEAATYCNTLKLAGVADWQLPSYTELASLLLSEVQGKCYIPLVFQVPDPALPGCDICSPACDWFWSASFDGNCPNPPKFPLAAMIAINFSVGYSATNCCGPCYSDRVRCVRYENVKPLN